MLQMQIYVEMMQMLSDDSSSEMLRNVWIPPLPGDDCVHYAPGRGPFSDHLDPQVLGRSTHSTCEVGLLRQFSEGCLGGRYPSWRGLRPRPNPGVNGDRWELL